MVALEKQVREAGGRGVVAGLEKQVGGGSGRTREAGGRGAIVGLEKQVGGG